MSQSDLSRPTWKVLVDDHRELHKLIDELCDWINQLSELGQPHFGELSMRLGPLRDCLQKHFHDEERDGYMSEVLAVAPRFSREVEQLHQQHAKFLEQLDLLRDRLKTTGEQDASWTEAQQDVEAFLAELQAHENRETDLAQAAFEDDVGVGD